MECIVHHLGMALGGRAGASFAQRLTIPVSNDTLLRVVRRRARPRAETLAVVGVDHWGFRRNHRYGKIVCDLERRRIVKLLPDREIATVAAWLSRHPTIRVVSRDRVAGMARRPRRRCRAIQVADRWHLMKNARAAFLVAVKQSMRAIRASLDATVIDPQLLTSAERVQLEGYLRREEIHAMITGLAAEGVSITEIVRRTGRRRKLGSDRLYAVSAPTSKA
jgi:transposase